MLSTFRHIYRKMFVNELSIRAQCLGLLASGDIDGAFEVFEKSSQGCRRGILRNSVDSKPSLNRTQLARAPDYQQQVKFFTRTRPLVKLSAYEDLMYHVALTYQAIEADDRVVLTNARRFLKSQIPSLKRSRACFDLAFVRRKRGHHLYYSGVMALLHAAIDVSDFESFETLSDDAEAFFRCTTLRTKDKGFGWALPNAMRIAALSASWWRLHGQRDRADAKWSLMPEMLKLAVSRRVGPLEYSQVKRSFGLFFKSEAFRGDPSMEISIELFGELIRLRNENARGRLFDKFKSAAAMQ